MGPKPWIGHLTEWSVRASFSHNITPSLSHTRGAPTHRIINWTLGTHWGYSRVPLARWQFIIRWAILCWSLFQDGRSTDVSYYSVLIISIPILSYYKARRPGSSSWNYLMDVENKASYCPSMQGARDYFTSCVLLLCNGAAFGRTWRAVKNNCVDPNEQVVLLVSIEAKEPLECLTYHHHWMYIWSWTTVH
jgi:hypothetical protein